MGLQAYSVGNYMSMQCQHLKTTSAGQWLMKTVIFIVVTRRDNPATGTVWTKVLGCVRAVHRQSQSSPVNAKINLVPILPGHLEFVILVCDICLPKPFTPHHIQVTFSACRGWGAGGRQPFSLTPPAIVPFQRTGTEVWRGSVRIVGFRKRSLISQRKDTCLQCHAISQPPHPQAKSPGTALVVKSHGVDNGGGERRAGEMRYHHWS